ncbi:hypothetical protein [Methylomonas sp. CM2]|uniref:hypothetical protein n=1 Tax=Methylomonas sp. CM2 TaxID=3417647 RepID=UPI003CF3D7F2
MSGVDGVYGSLTIAGADNPLSAPIYLVKLDTVNAKTVGDQDVTLTLPDLPGFALEVKRGSVTFPDGKTTGKLLVTPVNASKIPMAPPNGMQPQFIVTIQPVGAKFDPPARLTLPTSTATNPARKWKCTPTTTTWKNSWRSVWGRSQRTAGSSRVTTAWE